MKDGERGAALATGENLRFGYVDVAVATDRIYALFSGRTRAGHPEDAVYANQVHVFDWSGALLSVLHLDADAMVEYVLILSGEELYDILAYDRDDEGAWERIGSYRPVGSGERPTRSALLDTLRLSGPETAEVDYRDLVIGGLRLQAMRQ